MGRGGGESSFFRKLVFPGKTGTVHEFILRGDFGRKQGTGKKGVVGARRRRSQGYVCVIFFFWLLVAILESYDRLCCLARRPCCGGSTWGKVFFFFVFNSVTFVGIFSGLVSDFPPTRRRNSVLVRVRTPRKTRRV